MDAMHAMQADVALVVLAAMRYASIKPELRGDHSEEKGSDHLRHWKLSPCILTGLLFGANPLVPHFA
jgi:hypothetical protein